MENSKLARTFLGLNAIFSLLMGTSFLLVADDVAGLLFVGAVEWQPIALRILAIGLIVFGLGLILMARNHFVTKVQVISITAMDVGWILGSFFLLNYYGHLFTSFGQVANHSRCWLCHGLCIWPIHWRTEDHMPSEPKHRSLSRVKKSSLLFIER